MSIAAGNGRSFALKSNGTLWAWGGNGQGQLGDGTFTQRLVPTQIGSATNWTSVSVGRQHVLALRADGTIWSWGQNANGQLGDGDTNHRFTPAQIGSATDWISISAGVLHSLARKSDRTVWAWGDNTYGQLGDNGSTTQRLVPTLIVGIHDTDLETRSWVYIETGDHHNISIRVDGTLWAWGYNANGELGDNSTANRFVPTQVGSATDWSFATVKAGEAHTVARKADGTLWVWGYNGHGQLGDDSSTNRIVPTQIG